MVTVESTVERWTRRINDCSTFYIAFSIELFKDPLKSHIQYCIVDPIYLNQPSKEPIKLLP